MMKKYKKHLIASSIIILLPIMIGLILWKALPDQMATHWNFQGQADGISSKGVVIFAIPVVMLILQWLGIFITEKDMKNRNQSHKIFIMAIWIVPIISLISSAIIFGSAFNIYFNFTKILLLLPAILFIIFGNYMPKCKQNYTIGIKVRWTLHNEENWNKTHRFAGWLWFYGGIIYCIILILLPMEIALSFVFPCLLTISFLPVFYSYFYYRKQLSCGRVTKEEMKLSGSEKKVSIVAFTTIVIIMFVVIGILLPAKYKISFGENEFSIETNVWENITINYGDIESIEYYENKEKGVRTFGYGTPFIVMGECENSTWGKYTAYIYLDTAPCIALTVNNKLLVINGKDSEETRVMYETIREGLKGPINIDS